MKSTLTILKAASTIIFLIGLVIGFTFFRVWQKNQRPTVTKVTWSEEKILLGHSSQLQVIISAPWHREIVNPVPLSHPSFLIPVERDAVLKKGTLSLNGQRTWHLNIPFVATDTKSLKGLTTSLSFKPTRRISPNSLTLSLPPLSLTSPADLPSTPQSPNTFLSEEKPSPTPTPLLTAEENKKTWLWLLSALLLLPFAYFILKRSGVLKTTPPWEKALSKLEKLDPHSQPRSFYSKLTDVLKQYTSERYSVRARSKTSTEFIKTLLKCSEIPKTQIEQLRSFANLADSVKFADLLPQQTEAPKSLELIRTFITTTTPSPKSSDV